MLDESDLNDWDPRILDVLQDYDATPILVRKLLKNEGYNPPVRQYINGRMIRLAEHDHLDNLEGSGVYRLIEDPREN